MHRQGTGPLPYGNLLRWNVEPDQPCCMHRLSYCIV